MEGKLLFYPLVQNFNKGHLERRASKKFNRLVHVKFQRRRNEKGAPLCFSLILFAICFEFLSLYTQLILINSKYGFYSYPQLFSC